MGVLVQFPNDSRSSSGLPDHFFDVMKPESLLKGESVI